MKIEEIDAIKFKNDQATEVKENVVKDETITLTINGNISRKRNLQWDTCSTRTW